MNAKSTNLKTNTFKLLIYGIYETNAERFL